MSFAVHESKRNHLQQNRVCLQHPISAKGVFLRYNKGRGVLLFLWEILVKDVKLLEHKIDKSDGSLFPAKDALCVAICDDEKTIRDLLEEKVREMIPSVVIEQFPSGKELLRSKTKADILFLDIQMPEMDGMEVAKILRKERMDTLLVFITAAPEYVFEAFDVGAFHYLVKPLSDDKFHEVFGKAVREVENRKFKDGETDEKYMMVQAGGIHTKILFRDMIYAEVFNRKVIIHTVNGDTEYYGRLSDLEKKAGEDFFRPHRSYLIHFKFVQRYDAKSIVMKKGTALIAKQNYSEFVRQYLKYNQRKGREIK